MWGCSFDDLNTSGWRIRDANLAGLRVEKANLCGASITAANVDRMTIDGLPVADLLEYWRAGHAAGSA